MNRDPSLNTVIGFSLVVGLAGFAGGAFGGNLVESNKNSNAVNVELAMQRCANRLGEVATESATIPKPCQDANIPTGTIHILNNGNQTIYHIPSARGLEKEIPNVVTPLKPNDEDKLTTSFVFPVVGAFVFFGLASIIKERYLPQKQEEDK